MSGATVDRDLDSLWAELRRMQDKQAIVELHDRFAATMDAADYDGLSAVFAENAVMVHLASQRMITNHRIALDGEQARAVVMFRAAHLNKGSGSEHSAHAHEGWYLSDLIRMSDGWRFARLKRVNLAEVLSSTPNGLVAEEIYRSVAVAKEPWPPSR